MSSWNLGSHCSWRSAFLLSIPFIYCMPHSVVFRASLWMSSASSVSSSTTWMTSPSPWRCTPTPRSLCHRVGPTALREGLPATAVSLCWCRHLSSVRDEAFHGLQYFFSSSLWLNCFGWSVKKHICQGRGIAWVTVLFLLFTVTELFWVVSKETYLSRDEAFHGLQYFFSCSLCDIIFLYTCHRGLPACSQGLHRSHPGPPRGQHSLPDLWLGWRWQPKPPGVHQHHERPAAQRGKGQYFYTLF